jgi:hypothetical protein
VKRGFLKNAQSTKPAMMLRPPAIANGCASMDLIRSPPVLQSKAVIKRYSIDILCVTCNFLDWQR